MTNQTINNKKEGVWKEYENGQLRYEFNYLNGQLNGLCITWNVAGQTTSIKYYKNGKKHGLCKYWDENTGLLRWEGYYVNGKIHGASKYWDHSGKYLTETIHIE